MLLRILIWSILLLVLSSCIDAPFEIFLDKKINITEDQVNEISNEILKNLININEKEFAPSSGSPGGVSTQICKEAFIHWITEQVRKKHVPKRKVGSEEYGKSSTDPKIHQCPAIDIEKEFNKAKSKIDLTTIGLKPYSISLKPLRENLSQKSKCATKFIDPEEHRLTIDNIELKMEKNTINFEMPAFEIYYSNFPVDEKDLKNINIIDKFKNEGAITFLAATKKVPAKFTGVIPFSMVDDKETLLHAQEKISSLQTELIAVPRQIDTKIKSENINGEPYFIMPEGAASISIIIQISVRIKLGDAFCFMEEPKKKVNN